MNVKVSFLDSTRRDFFAANAPECPDWFEPKMEAECYIPTSDELSMNEYSTLKKEYYDEYEKQMVFQWPWYYADMMIKQSGISGAGKEEKTTKPFAIGLFGFEIFAFEKR